MTLFNYPKWVASQITDHKKNIDKKIFVVGPAGAGKSMTGLKLARSIAKWISYYVNAGLDNPKKKDFFTSAGFTEKTTPNDFFSIDEDHLAIIDTSDLVKLMVKKLRKFSVKVIDDCGAAKGFNARQAMTKENIDLISIYGTNRTDNGVTIICVQDTSFTDKRMRMLANEIVDLTNWYSVYIPKINAKSEEDVDEIRIGKLWKIRMDNEAKYGIQQCRFMTYEHGVWATQESIACTLPDREDKEAYDKIRKIKQDAQSEQILNIYTKHEEVNRVNANRKRCPSCNAADIRFREKTMDYKCKSCGFVFPREINYNNIGERAQYSS